MPLELSSLLKKGFEVKIVLPFEILPKGLPLFRNVCYLALDLSGIQNFIFSQTDQNPSREEAQSRSEFVERILGTVHEKMREIPQYLFGSASGGNFTCAFLPTVNQEALCGILDSLQKSLFVSTAGKITFYYALCRAKCIPSARFSQRRHLHASAHLGKLLQKEKYHCRNLLFVQNSDADGSFSCFPPQKVSEKKGEDQAVVKLDLDHLGAFFREILEYDRSLRAGKALDGAIKQALKSDPRIEPVFAGGDDVFFLCPLSEVLSVLASFYRNLRNLLKKSEVLSDYAQNGFGISGGVCALRNRLDSIPFLSYLHAAEAALSSAKTKGKKNCLYFKMPTCEEYYLSWKDLLFLSDSFSKNRPVVLSQHRFSGADPICIPLLCDQLILAEKQKHSVSKKDEKRLYEIKKKSV